MNIISQSQPPTVPTFQLSNLQTDWRTELSEHLASLRLGQRSVTLARQHLHLFAAWYEAQFNQPFDPHTVTHYAIAQYRHHILEEARLKAATWNSRHWALGILCAWVNSDAMDGIAQKAHIQRSDMHRRLTDPEYHRLHEVLERNVRAAVPIFKYRNAISERAAVSVMLEAGLRVDEVHQLDKTDITLHERSGFVLVRHGKGEKERKVPLNDIARKALSAWIELRSDDNPALFDGKSTPRLTTRSIQRIIEDLRAAARIPDLRCHSLRFDFAKRCEKRLIKQSYGRSEIIRIIMDLLGHDSAPTTERYLCSSTDELMSAVGEVE